MALKKLKYWICLTHSLLAQLLPKSGVFNTFLPCAPAGYKTNFAIVTWNARSLFCGDRGVMHRKLKLLQQNIINKDIFCIQETKGSWAMVDRHFRLIKRTHLGFL